ncbi:MAG: class I SAM-dependent methyltransferase [Formivibrio sp.]|nr:class I SAM-dependent methyltransferase [Formivibrio sp.]
MNEHPVIRWIEHGENHSARWRSESGTPPPNRVAIADDTITADAAYRLACEGTAILWRGDFQNARQLLQALGRRIDRKPRKPRKPAVPPTATEAFHLHRMAQSQRSRILGMLLLPFEHDHNIPLRRAPDVRQACTEAYGPESDAAIEDTPAHTDAYIASMRELLGLIGAHEWRKNGVAIPALDDRIHPHYGVFAPIRSEYLELVANAPLATTCNLAFDIGTGTGVLAAMLAKRGIVHIVATDLDPRALTCARENITRLGLDQQIDVLQADLFPEGRALLVVCNPPWVPAKPSSPIEHAVYDPESRMLRGFLNGLAAHLQPGGEGWLVLSDLAEHLGLRSRAELLAEIEKSGLTLVDRIDIQPRHPKASDDTDPLHTARAAEITSLWRLAAK